MNFLDIKNQLDIKKQCEKYYLPLWQCPHFLFVVMGIFIIIVALATYFIGIRYIEDPLIIALVVLILTIFLLLISFLITKSYEKIAEVSKLKSEFINIISHQLRSPIVNLNWASDILFSNHKGISYEIKQEFVPVIRENIERMTELINELVLVSKIEMGKKILQLQDVDLPKLIETIIFNFKPLIAKKNIRINFHKKGDFSKTFRTDFLKMKMIVENLVENAIRYTPLDGCIDIFLTLSLNKKAILKISDTGIGIKKDDYQMIFKKFCRSEKAKKMNTQGLGLGLYIVKTFTGQLGGRISFNSKVNKGTTFIVEIPSIEKNNLPL